MADRKEKVILDLDAGPYVRGLATAGGATNAFGREVDRTSGRLRLFADAAAIVGPALIPIGAVGVPALTGLASAGAAAALGVGTMVAAFQGVGGAMEAVNKAQLEPTAENLEAARSAMQALGPDARELVRQVQEMRPAFTGLRDAAAAGLFPGLTESLVELDGVLPRVEKILFAIGDAAGGVTEEFADGIAGPRGREFLRFIQAEMPSALTDLARTAGNVTGGLAEMWMAFAPLNRGFSAWMLASSESFDQWAQGLAKTEGFQEFVAYISENGPRVADALGAIGNALLQIVEAAAPLGGPVLGALESVADVIAAIADSDAGPAIMATVTALALLSRGMKTFSAVSGAAWVAPIKGAEGFGAKMTAARGPLLRGGAALTGLGIAASGAADGIGLTNTASLGLMGLMGGPWGAAVGGAVGLALDWADSQSRAQEEINALAETLDQQTGAITDNSRELVKNELYSSGMYDRAKTLGLSLEEVTDAALGNEAALARVNAELDRFRFGSVPDGMSYEEWAPLGLVAEDIYEAINGTNGKLSEAREKIAIFGAAGKNATGEVTEGFGEAQTAAEAFADGLIRLNDILAGRSAMRQYEQSLDDFTARAADRAEVLHELADAQRDLANADTVSERGSARERIADLQKQAAALENILDIDKQAGRDTQELLDGIVSSAIEVAETMKGSNRVEFLKQARADFVDTTAKLLGSREAAKALWDRLVQVDKQKVKPDIDVETAAALNDIGSVAARLKALDGDSATVTVNYQTTGRPVAPDGPFRPGLASGGTVPGPRWPYADKTLILAAPGEELITNRNGEADRFRADRAAGRIPAYAAGGTVERYGHRYTGGTSVTNHVERVIERLPSGRVVAHIEGFGDVALRFVDRRIQKNADFMEALR